MPRAPAHFYWSRKLRQQTIFPSLCNCTILWYLLFSCIRKIQRCKKKSFVRNLHGEWNRVIRFIKLLLSKTNKNSLQKLLPGVYSIWNIVKWREKSCRCIKYYNIIMNFIIALFSVTLCFPFLYFLYNLYMSLWSFPDGLVAGVSAWSLTVIRYKNSLLEVKEIFHFWDKLCWLRPFYDSELSGLLGLLNTCTR